jgi:hypothetical protein
MEIAPNIRRVAHPAEILVLWIVRGIVVGAKAGFIAGGSLGLLCFIVGALWGAPIGAAVGAVAGTVYGTLVGITLAVAVATGRIDPKGVHWPAQSKKTARRSVNTFAFILLISLVIGRDSPAVQMTLLVLMPFYPLARWTLDNTGVPTWGSLTWGEGDSSQQHKEKRAQAKRQMRKGKPQGNSCV